jgi:hypothetical protein
MNIPWTSSEEVALEYTKRAYEIYPLPGFWIKILATEIKNMQDSATILETFNKYKKDIDAGISFMQWNPGELTEATSSMLSRANLMAKLHIEHTLFVRSEIEKLYKDLIQFDQERWVTVNKQYTLLYYANFLAAATDDASAQKVIDILIHDGLEGALTEALPKYNPQEFSALKAMKWELNYDTKKLIEFIWSKN